MKKKPFIFFLPKTGSKNVEIKKNKTFTMIQTPFKHRVCVYNPMTITLCDDDTL